MSTQLWTIPVSVIASVFLSLGPLYFKFGSKNMNSIRSMIKNKELYIGVMFYMIGTVFALIAYSAGEFSVIYPIFALSYVWSCFLSMKFLDEKMNSWKWFGVVGIILGVFLIGLSI